MVDLVGSGFGFEAVMAMPWTDARDYSAAVSRRRKAVLVEHAVASRAAQAGKNDWMKWIREMTQS